MTRRILVVEDEPLLAMALTEQLKELGYQVAGVAPTITKAMKLIEHCDAAILDCNLRGESAEALAQALSERGIPFLFHTGYSARQISQRFSHHAPLLTKPVSADVLSKAVAQLLCATRCSGLNEDPQ